MKKLLYVAALPAFLVSASTLVSAATSEVFVNGGFETGTGNSPSGWTLHSGTWKNGTISGISYTTNSQSSDSAIITNNTLKDSYTLSNLSMVYSGAQSFRLGNLSVSGNTPNAHWASASQSFANFNASSLSFAFAAVLEDPTSGHTAAQEPRFTFQVKDETTNTFLYNISISNPTGNTGGLTWHRGLVDNSAGSVFMYTDWQSVTLDTSSAIGDTLSVFVASYDCSLGGHDGWAYIDGFTALTAAAPNAGVDRQIYNPDVPEPSTYGLIGIGALALAVASRRRKKA